MNDTHEADALPQDRVSQLKHRRMLLVSELGAALYEETKRDERLFLRYPELYLEIARIDEELASMS